MIDRNLKKFFFPLIFCIICMIFLPFFSEAKECEALINAEGSNFSTSIMNVKSFYDNFDEEVFKNCIKDDSFFSKDANGYTPLMLTILSRIKPKFIDLIFNNLPKDSHSKLLNVEDNRGRNAFLIAIEETDNFFYLDKLISFDLDSVSEGLNYLDDNTKNIDYLFSIEGSEDFIALLFAYGASSDFKLNQISDKGALLAIYNSKTFIELELEDLIYNGPINNFNECDKLYDAELLKVISTGEFNFCIFDEEQEIQWDNNGDHPIHLIAKYGNDAQLIDSLLYKLKDQKGVSIKKDIINSIGDEGFTPLQLAAKYTNYPKMITRLIAWGADPDFVPASEKKSILKNPIKKTFGEDLVEKPIHIAASRKDELRGQILLRLISGGADVLAKDKKGHTALHKLIETEKESIGIYTDLEMGLLIKAEILQRSIVGELTKGKKMREVKNNGGATPLMYAAEKNISLSVIEELLKYGADPDIKDDKDWTALLLYSRYGSDANVFELLFEKSDQGCEAQKDGANILSFLKSNKRLSIAMTSGGRSPKAIFKEKCPGV